MMFYIPVDKHSSEAEDNSIVVQKTERLSDFSSQSILSAMDHFVKAVNNMNETVMVPSRLLDMSVNNNPLHKVPSLLQGNTNPRSLYTVLNSVKNDLIRGLSSNEDDKKRNSNVSPPVVYIPWSVSHPTTIPKTSSSSDFESEDDEDVWVDSDLEGMGGIDTASDVMDTLRKHLIRLNLYLNSLTNTATYITDCYKNELIT